MDIIISWAVSAEVLAVWKQCMACACDLCWGLHDNQRELVTSPSPDRAELYGHHFYYF